MSHEVNERHERAALIALLEGKDGEDFVAEALTEQGASKIIADGLAELIGSRMPIRAVLLGGMAQHLLTAVEEYIRSCPAFEDAVERAEQDDREAAADARYDAQRDDELTGHGRGK